MNNITQLPVLSNMDSLTKFPEGRIPSIMKSIGMSSYVWNLEDDSILWSDNFLNLIGLKPGRQADCGRNFERLLSADSLNTRFGVISSMGLSDKVEHGETYQCIYAFAKDNLVGEDTVWIEDTGKWYPGISGRPVRAEGFVRIINDRRKSEERLKQKIDFDELTGLPNRRFLESNIEMTAKTCFTEETSAAFLCFNMESMDLINEIYGYAVGDDILHRVGEILKTKMRGDDVIARLSGSKLGLILKNCSSSEVFVAAKRFLGAIASEVYWSKNGPVAMSASIGVCMLPRHATTAEAAIEAAIRGLIDGKKDNSIRIGVYQPDPMADIKRREQAESMANVIKAIQDGRIRLAFQPVLDAKTREVLFHEALLRMEDEEGNIGPSAAFIAVAEKLGLIRVIDRYALDLTIQTLIDYPDAKLSVNVSLKTAEDPNWLSVLACRLGENPDMARRLIVEITESHAASDILEARKFVDMVRGLGCMVAIDDFGAGYTSFANLRDLEVDWIKLDGSYCEGLKDNLRNQAFIKALMMLAKVHDARTVIEWVDNSATADMLAEWGADALQGNSLGRPLTEYPWPKRVNPDEEASSTDINGIAQ